MIPCFLLHYCDQGGGEPLQPGAVCGGAGSQLSLHGLSQRDAEEHPGAGSLRCAAHHLLAGRYRTLPSSPLLPLPRPAQVMSPAVAKCWAVTCFSVSSLILLQKLLLSASPLLIYSIFNVAGN